MKKQKLSALEIRSFVTTLEDITEHQLKGGSRREPTVASFPKEACQPVPTTNLNWSRRWC